MKHQLLQFLTSEQGAVTVDWTMLSSAAVGLSLATAAMLTGTVDMVTSRLDGELRDQQLSDGFVQFTSAHFEPLYARGKLDPEVAAELFDMANEAMNQELLDALEQGIEAFDSGETMSANDIAALIAAASVAYQRNLIPDHILEYYFGFDGSAGAISSAI